MAENEPQVIPDDDELADVVQTAEPNAEPVAQSSPEQRKYPRYRVSVKVHIKLSDGDVALAKGVNLSMGGIYVEYGAAADAGSEFEMAFDLSLNDQFKRVFVKAKVVRCVIVGGKDVYGIAFNFINFAKDTDQVLEKFLELRGLKQSAM